MFLILVVIMVLSILLSTFGLYALHRRRRGNKKQQVLLKNLALVEIIKCVYDLFRISLYYFALKLYNQALIYFMVIKVNLMSILYCTFAIVNIDRLLCVIMKQRYSNKVTQKAVNISSFFRSYYMGNIFPIFTMLFLHPCTNLNHRFHPDILQTMPGDNG